MTFHLADLWESVAGAVPDRTALVCTGHVYYTSGYIQDVARLAELCHRKGAALVVDAYQSIGALPFVLYPLFIGAMPHAAVRVPAKAPKREEELEAVVALREIEFDRETGKLSDADYAELKERYTARALSAMRASSQAAVAEATGGVSGAADPIEAAVLAYRSHIKQCANCGPRPEPDAVYCSNCGSYLPGECGSCGAHIAEPGAAFCASCGTQLAA